MNCPVCGKEARAYIYYCAKCAVYVHEKCWPKHVGMAHKEKTREKDSVRLTV